MIEDYERTMEETDYGYLGDSGGGGAYDWGGYLPPDQSFTPGDLIDSVTVTGITPIDPGYDYLGGDLTYLPTAGGDATGGGTDGNFGGYCIICDWPDLTDPTGGRANSPAPPPTPKPKPPTSNGGGGSGSGLGGSGGSKPPTASIPKPGQTAAGSNLWLLLLLALGVAVVIKKGHK